MKVTAILDVADRTRLHSLGLDELTIMIFRDVKKHAETGRKGYDMLGCGHSADGP